MIRLGIYFFVMGQNIIFIYEANNKHKVTSHVKSCAIQYAQKHNAMHMRELGGKHC